MKRKSRRSFCGEAHRLWSFRHSFHVRQSAIHQIPSCDIYAVWTKCTIISQSYAGEKSYELIEYNNMRYCQVSCSVQISNIPNNLHFMRNFDRQRTHIICDTHNQSCPIRETFDWMGKSAVRLNGSNVIAFSLPFRVTYAIGWEMM